MFIQPKNLLFTGGTFTNVTNLGKRGIDILQEGIAPGAFHNSAERFDPPKCHPQTRSAVLEAIMAWIQDDQKTSFIMWLYGPAGAGKSAIAQTIAEMCHKLGILAASFFWSRTVTGRNDEKRLMATLVYQLLVAIPRMRTHVEEVLENDPALLSRSLEAQMESLIVGPLNKAFLDLGEPADTGGAAKLIILDGLDECGTGSVERYLLEVISAVAHKFPTPILFLIASRPEHEIRDTFNAEPLLPITTRLALDDKYKPDDDIRLFFVDSFTVLKKKHTLRLHLPPSWPTSEQMDTLVKKSSGQFIYAATVVKFVKYPHRRPDEQLDIILGISDPGNNTPFAELDALYRYIFSTVEDLPRTMEILLCLLLVDSRMINMKLGGGPWTAGPIEALLCYKPGDLHLILINLNSVVSVPDITEYQSEIRVFHASLVDFLLDPTRSRDFHISKADAHAKIGQYFLRYLRHKPRVNSRTEIFDHKARDIVAHQLVEHCLKSRPTKRLLKDFSRFNFQRWFCHRCCNPRILLHEMEKLNFWIRGQERTVKEYFGHEKSLSEHLFPSWRGAIDKLFSDLLQGLLHFEAGKHVLTALTDPNLFQNPSTNTVSVLKNMFSQADWVKAEKIILFIKDINEPVIKNNPHISELQNFLRSPERAGPYFVNGEMYGNLSLQMARAVVEIKMTKTIGYGHGLYPWFAISSFPFFLSNANYTSELAEYLLRHNLEALGVLNFPEIDIKPLQGAINLYLGRKPQ